MSTPGQLLDSLLSAPLPALITLTSHLRTHLPSLTPYLLPPLSVLLAPTTAGYTAFTRALSTLTFGLIPPDPPPLIPQTLWSIMTVVILRWARGSYGLETGSPLPPLDWVLNNRWKVLTLLYAALLWGSPGVVAFRAGNGVWVGGVHVVMKVLPGLCEAAGVVFVLAYWGFVPVSYWLHGALVAGMRREVLRAMAWSGVVNVVFLGAWGARVFGEDGVRAVMLGAILTGCVAFMKAGGGDYGPVANVLVDAAVAGWGVYTVWAPYLFTAGVLETVGTSFAWWGNFAEWWAMTHPDTGPRTTYVRPTRTPAQAREYGYKVAAVHRRVMAAYMAANARVQARAAEIAAYVKRQADEREVARALRAQRLPQPKQPKDKRWQPQKRVPKGPVSAPGPKGPVGVLMVSIPECPLQGVAAVDLPGDEAGMAARRTIWRLIAEGYDRRLGAGNANDLEVRMAPKQNIYPPKAAKARVTPRMPVWTERTGDSPADSDDSPDQSQEVPISYAAYPPLPAPPPIRAPKGPVGVPMNDPSEWDDPEWAFAERPGQLDLRPPPRPAGWKLGRDPDELVSNSEDESAEETDSDYGTPAPSWREKRYGGHSLFYTAGKEAEFRELARPMLPVGARYRNGQPYVRDPALPPLADGEDDYVYATDDSVSTAGLYAPTSPLPSLSIPRGQALTDFQNTTAALNAANLAAVSALRNRPLREIPLNTHLDTFLNAHACARMATKTLGIVTRTAIQVRTEAADALLTANNVNDHYNNIDRSSHRIRPRTPLDPPPPPDPALDAVIARAENTAAIAPATVNAELTALMNTNSVLNNEYADLIADCDARRGEMRLAREAYRLATRRSRGGRGWNDPDPTGPGNLANMPAPLPAPLDWTSDSIPDQTRRDRRRKAASSMEPQWRPKIPPPAAKTGAPGWEALKAVGNVGADADVLDADLREVSVKSVSSRRPVRGFELSSDQPDWRGYAWHNDPRGAPAEFVPAPRWERRAIYEEGLDDDVPVEVKPAGEPNAGLVPDGSGGFGYPRFAEMGFGSPRLRVRLREALIKCGKWMRVKNGEYQSPENSEHEISSSPESALSSPIPIISIASKAQTEKILSEQREELSKWNTLHRLTKSMLTKRSHTKKLLEPPSRPSPISTEPTDEQSKTQTTADAIITTYLAAAAEHRKYPSRPTSSLQRRYRVPQWVQSAFYSTKPPAPAAMGSRSPELRFDTWMAEVARRKTEAEVWLTRILALIGFLLALAAMVPLARMQIWSSGGVRLEQAPENQSHQVWEVEKGREMGERYIQWGDGKEEMAAVYV